MKVNILLSTYNGEHFLAEQIDSILDQTYQDWTLLIRDDGSSDSTPDIISSYVNRDSRIQFINPDHRENVGVIESFYTLVKEEIADFYFFCDQDDVWLPEKLERCLKEGKTFSKDLPLLVYTDLKVVDQNLAIIHESMIKVQSDHANTSLLQELTENTVTGGTTMINRSLADLWLARSLEHIVMHDWFLALIAASKGKLIYLDLPTQLYRQHDANVLGARTLSKRFRNWLRPHKLLAKYWWLIDSSQEQAQQLLQLDLSPEQRQLIEDYLSLTEVSFKERHRLLKDRCFRKNRAFHTLVFRTLILTKLGYKAYKTHGYTP